MRRFPPASLLAGVAAVTALAAGCARGADPRGTISPSPEPAVSPTATTGTGTGAPPDGFAYTLVIGFSQTAQWGDTVGRSCTHPARYRVRKRPY
ncbi:MAG: hypothetical protein ACT4PO_15160 [Actinomycetota bacterium]